jgi:hypothetical protein
MVRRDQFATRCNQGAFDLLVLPTCQEETERWQNTSHGGAPVALGRIYDPRRLVHQSYVGKIPAWWA